MLARMPELSLRIVITLLFACLLFVAGGAYWRSSSDQSDRGGFRILEQHLYFVENDYVKDKIERVIPISNLTESNLKIEEVQTSCACMVPDFDEKLLLPGQSTEIPIEIKVGRVGGIDKQSVTVAFQSGKKRWLEKVEITILVLEDGLIAPDNVGISLLKGYSTFPLFGNAEILKQLQVEIEGSNGAIIAELGGVENVGGGCWSRNVAIRVGEDEGGETRKDVLYSYELKFSTSDRLLRRTTVRVVDEFYSEIFPSEIVFSGGQKAANDFERKTVRFSGCDHGGITVVYDREVFEVVSNTAAVIVSTKSGYCWSGVKYIRILNNLTGEEIGSVRARCLDSL